MDLNEADRQIAEYLTNEYKSAAAVPGNAKPTEPEPNGTAPADAKPIEPAANKPAAEAKPNGTVPADAKPNGTSPADAKPAATSTGTKQTYDLKEALKHPYPDIKVQWNRRDAIIYALSVGAHNTDYPIVYENSEKLPGGKPFQVFPTFATTLSFKGMDLDTTDFSKKFSKAPAAIPPPNAKAISQASQFVEVLEPLPETSGDGEWKVTSRVVGVRENSKGVEIDNELHVIGPENKKYVRLISTVRHNLMVANGTPFEVVTASGISPPQPVKTLGRPKWITTAPTWPEQSCLFRLNGDYNPLHIIPGVGAPTYPVVICHGAGMFGLAARAILEKIADSDPSTLKAIKANFVEPLIPGDALTIDIWDLGASGPNGTSVIVFEARNPKNQVCLGEGVAYITKLATDIKETNPRATGFTGLTPSTPFLPPSLTPSPRVNAAGLVHRDTSSPFRHKKGTTNPWSVGLGLVLFGPAALAAAFFTVLGYFSNILWTVLLLVLKASDDVDAFLRPEPAKIYASGRI